MISAIVLTKNNEDIIEKCLTSISWCNEIIVVDDYSEDNTSEIANRSGAKVFKRRLNGDFSSQRNYGLNKTNNRWVLYIDSDEIVSGNLRKEIEDAVIKDDYDGYLINRTDVVWGEKIKFGEFRNNYILRLGKKGKGEWKRKVHEKWKINGKIGKLQNSLDHFSHKSVSSFLTKINTYTDIRARELYEKGVRSSFISIIIYPKAKFIQNYIFRLGILDGVAGLILAILMSLHSFLVRGKLWLLWKK